LRVFFLMLLSMLLGLLIFLKLEYNDAARAANEVKQEFITQEYRITDIDETGFYGKNDDGNKIFIKKELITKRKNLKIHDTVIVYFEKDQRKDGVVKVEKK
jgi:hypothetical protein